MGSYSVTCHTAEVTFPPLPQPKLVLDLATLEGCKAELTCYVKADWPGIEPTTSSRKTNTLLLHQHATRPMLYTKQSEKAAFSFIICISK